jgi:hypothetical protein
MKGHDPQDGLENCVLFATCLFVLSSINCNSRFPEQYVSGNMQPPSRMRVPSGAVIEVVTERETLEFKNGRGLKIAFDG